MPHHASRRGAADMGTILMIVAFAVIGGFMFWLNGEAAEERALREVVEEEMPEEPVGPTVAEVMLGDIENGFNADDHVGETIRTPRMEVASLLGTQGFWLNTPSGPFLVSWSPELLAEGVTVSQGDQVVVTGEMRTVDLSAIEAWAAQGSISENDRIVAEFATHLVRAETVEVQGGGMDGGDMDSGN